MHYLITGHTGFKGAWLALILTQRGHTVSGLSLDPLPGGIYETARVADLLKTDERGDIRDLSVVSALITRERPDFVFHLAAQPLVRESYRDPRTTMETNVMGSLNVLEAVGASESVKGLLYVTTDKVYRNVDQEAGYREADPLGGADPYSASKAMADLLAQSWVASFPGTPTAIARGGNVIGGGDVSPDRLVPDLLRAFAMGTTTAIRYPRAIRPWQHVLDCLNGYLVLADALLSGKGAGEWNIGPGRESFVPVGAVADLAAKLWGDGASWTNENASQPHEANILALDAKKARDELGWDNKLRFPESLEWTVAWQKAVRAGRDAREVTIEQIERFTSLQ